MYIYIYTYTNTHIRIYIYSICIYIYIYIKRPPLQEGMLDLCVRSGTFHAPCDIATN